MTRKTNRERHRRSVSWITDWEMPADRTSGSGRLVLADDGADPLAPQRRPQQVRLAPVDDLEALDQPAAGQQVEQHAVERQRRQVARLQLGDGDLFDQAGVRVV